MQPIDNYREDAQEGPLSARNAALLSAIAIFVVVAVIFGLSVSSEDQFRAGVLVFGPLALVCLSIVTRNPPLTIATIAICFMVGVVGIFSIGLPLIALAICLLAWFTFRTGDQGRREFTWNDVVTANLIIFPVLILLGLMVFA